MKRIRKMVSLQDITEKMVRENKNNELEHHLIQGMPARIFGETVAQKIQEMRIDGDTLLLCIPDLDWQICYQSRVGAQKWIGPSTEEALAKAAEDGKGVLIYPHAFVSEHVETLVELDIEYREVAEELGIHDYGRVSTVSVDPEFIDGLADMVRARAGEPTKEAQPDCGKRLCPSGFEKCCMNEPDLI